jgi:hypothetical protein
MGNYVKAKELFDTIPSLIDKRKINGKELPTEVLIKKKRESFEYLIICPYTVHHSCLLQRETKAERGHRS